jgi:hypothetical protein
MIASRVRYRVVAAAVTLAGVTYLDRVCVGVLARPSCRICTFRRSR